MKAGTSLVILILLFALVVSGCTTVERIFRDGSKTGPDNTASKETSQTYPSEIDLTVGKTAKLLDLEVVVLSVNITSFYEYYSDILSTTMIQRAKPGINYVLVGAEIKNTGSESKYISYTSFRIADSKGHSYGPMQYHGSEGLPTVKKLDPNQKTRGKVLFTIPESVEGPTIYYNFGSIATGLRLASWRI